MLQQQYQRQSISLHPGMIVWTQAYGFFKHKGIVSDRLYDGQPMIISCSGRTGEVREETQEQFSQGNAIFAEGYLGNLPVHQVLYRARQCIGMKYNLFSWNCEHFVRYAYGLEPSSPQLAATIVLAALGICIVAAARS